MTRVYVLLGLLTCTAAPAFGQATPQPAPPAVPATPARATVPAVPALPLVAAIPVPAIEIPDVAMQLDLADFRERSREFAEQARQQSEEMREQVRQNVEDARRQAEWSRELAMRRHSSSDRRQRSSRCGNARLGRGIHAGSALTAAFRFQGQTS